MTGPYNSLLVRMDIYFLYVLGASLCLNRNLPFVFMGKEMKNIP